MMSTVGSGGVCVWQESGGRFCVGAFGRNLASVAVKMFSNLICTGMLQILYFQSIFKDNAAPNCITLQQQQKMFHSR
jgi:hypothetical protein